MWNSFLINVKTSIRNTSSLFWVLAFPVILAALMLGIMGNLQDGYTAEAQHFAIVSDSNWKASPGADELVSSLSKKPKAGSDDTQLLIPTTVATKAEADTRLDSRKDIGYLYAGSDGLVNMVLCDREAASIQSDSTASEGIAVSILSASLGSFNQAKSARSTKSSPSTQILVRSGGQTYTKQIRLTHIHPSMTAPYFFAVLAMACLIGASTAAEMIARTQPNLSALGARRASSPSPKWRQAAGAFLASWLFSAVSLLVAYIFVRTVCGVQIGGRDPIALIAIAVGTFMATAFGSMMGAIPKLPIETKVGLVVGIDCTLSAFIGLYGSLAMDLNNAIQERAPVLHLINPVKQVSNLFYDIVYYDSLAPFARTCGILVIMAAIFLAACGLLLRKQRYEYL
ncbi:ABC transporter permease [Bifidobacterium sp. B4081]|uniref:ABC transporter permease n=1 Tax=unclassified Bifidobacterium TaxID=2608897 RepID=UPI00226A4452|nr:MULTISPECIES: ABC transporter permease [unclassified Bifidobacterium]MCX8643596.1 ABC transporter permease [Bifidobacterium sp. B4077]MCX8645778.1 ABC transporter permease [Bifidobacterium sp. B4081]MCX8647437.1 ABC transporter permease [Bifidobacterium sp. B4107]MCX8651617.1 ABC transporter permease [Bifidobacterium sp. B4111]MCX8658048.1 ABC transporter permease [Bifidobacterium sp. B4114]